MSLMKWNFIWNKVILLLKFPFIPRRSINVDRCPHGSDCLVGKMRLGSQEALVSGERAGGSALSWIRERPWELSSGGPALSWGWAGLWLVMESGGDPPSLIGSFVQSPHALIEQACSGSSPQSQRFSCSYISPFGIYLAPTVCWVLWGKHRNKQYKFCLS